MAASVEQHNSRESYLFHKDFNTQVLYIKSSDFWDICQMTALIVKTLQPFPKYLQGLSVSKGHAHLLQLHLHNKTQITNDGYNL